MTKKPMNDEAYFPSQSKYFALEGLVGSGKTTCLNHLAFERDVCCVSEPVHLFEHFQSHNPLALQYSDPLTNAVAAQLHILHVSAAHYGQIPPADALLQDKIILSERSIFSPKVFINANHRRGVFSDFTRDFLLGKLEDVTVDVRKLDAIIYFDAPPYLCKERIANRKREGEESACSQDFLDHLVWAHLDFIEYANVPVHKICITPYSTEEQVVEEVKRVIFEENNDAEGGKQVNNE